MRLDELSRAAHASAARVVYVANPDSPSGSFAGRAEIEAFRASLPADCVFLLDEAYAEFAPPDEIPPFVTDDPQIVRTRTFSKAYGLAGARIGYIHAHADAIAAFDTFRTQYGVNRVAQAGALASLGDTRFSPRSCVKRRPDVRSTARSAAASASGPLPSQTNFVCFDLGSRERAEAMVAALLRAGVFIRKPGAPPLDGHVRVTVGTAAERARFAARSARRSRPRCELSRVLNRDRLRHPR